MELCIWADGGELILSRKRELKFACGEVKIGYAELMSACGRMMIRLRRNKGNKSARKRGFINFISPSVTSWQLPPQREPRSDSANIAFLIWIQLIIDPFIKRIDLTLLVCLNYICYVSTNSLPPSEEGEKSDPALVQHKQNWIPVIMQQYKKQVKVRKNLDLLFSLW